MALSAEQIQVLERLNSDESAKPDQSDLEACQALHRCWAAELRWVCSDSPEFDAYCACPKRN